MNASTFRKARPEAEVDLQHLGWSYQEAVLRNLGLIGPPEQDKLRQSRVAIAGMGGVGSIHLVTLARLGVGRFRIADADVFETANFNRQYGANVHTIGQPKVEVMAQLALEVNPELDIEICSGKVTRENVDDFVRGCDVVLDGIDYFSFQARRMLFQQAWNAGVWAVTAGPVGFSTPWLLFDPNGMSFDQYFDIHDGMDPVDQFAAFTVGLAPRATHWGYFDLSQVNQSEARGPSLALACNLASGVAAAEVIKILLKRGPLRATPCYAQFDAYRCLLRRGRVMGGNRHPWQRIKRYLLAKRFRKIGLPQMNTDPM